MAVLLNDRSIKSSTALSSYLSVSVANKVFGSAFSRNIGPDESAILTFAVAERPIRNGGFRKIVVDLI